MIYIESEANMKELILDVIEDQLLYDLLINKYQLTPLENPNLPQGLVCFLVDDKLHDYITSLLKDILRKKIISFETKDGYLRINEDDVDYIESFKENIYLQDRFGKQFELKGPLYQIEESLEGYSFCRISKSYLCNLRQIRYIKTLYNQKLELTLKSNVKLEVTRSYLKEFKNRLYI